MSDKDWKEIAKTNAQKAWAETAKLSKKLKEDVEAYLKEYKKRKAEKTPRQDFVENSEFLKSFVFKPRDLPDGCSIESYSKGEIKFKFSAIRLGWHGISVIVKSVVLVAVIFIFLNLWLSGASGDEATIMLLIAFGLCGFAAVVHFYTNVSVRVTANKDVIHFGDLSIERQYYGGVMIGYESQYEKGPTFSQMRVVYGPWGEDVPYILKNYKANMILTWVNMMIDSTAEPDSTVHEIDHGDREQMFE